MDAATSLRRKGNEVLVTDGPFSETKEILGGLAVLDCADLDEALDRGAALPDRAVRHGRGAAGVRPAALMAGARPRRSLRP